MNMKTCDNGHIYDADLYPDGCPYCNPNRKVINYDSSVPIMQPVEFDGEDKKVAPLTSMHPHFNNDTGKTRPPIMKSNSQSAPRYISNQSMEAKTVAYSHNSGRGDHTPVTGWLVCIDGPSDIVGKSFEILDKVNTIGRTRENDITLQDDTITGVEHARIGYDSRNREFTLIPDRNSNTTYVNNHAVYTAIQLHAYDLIEFGDCKLIFLPLCGSHFGWDSGLSSES